MYPTSDAFRQAVRQSHTAVSTAEVWRGLQKILDLDGERKSVDAPDVHGRVLGERKRQRPDSLDTFRRNHPFR
jgi:hypothetical protein